jgi:5-methyltetrahydropteroyltriglutamate--homocysteine methyltransferase
MYKATANLVLPTTIIGSLPRPAWYTANLGNKSFLEAMVNSRFREQYTDALSVYLRDQETAGLDICTDGDCRFDEEVGGQSWTSYPPKHMSGFDNDSVALPGSGGGTAFPRGHILHDYVEAKIFPSIVGPVGRGKLQYVELWKAAQRLTKKPVKFGTITPELLAFAVGDKHYKSVAGSWRSPTPSTQSCTRSPTPAAR